MSGQGNGKAFSAFSSLRRFAREETEKAAEVTVQERDALELCELCAEPIPPHHRHLLNVESREILCACQACSILFYEAAASEGRYRLIPDRHLLLEDFALSDAQWESLRIPVDMAFFFHSDPAERVVAFYPGPMGPTESLLKLETWEALEAENPVLEDLEHDVEALLVNRTKGARGVFPGSDGPVLQPRWAYPDALAGVERRGQEVWEEIGRYFEELRGRSRKITKDAARLKAVEKQTAKASKGDRDG